MLKKGFNNINLVLFMFRFYFLSYCRHTHTHTHTHTLYGGNKLPRIAILPIQNDNLILFISCYILLFLFKTNNNHKKKGYFYYLFLIHDLITLLLIRYLENIIIEIHSELGEMIILYLFSSNQL